MATNMEVDGGNPKPQTGVMASAGTSGSVSISLHPLVIMNISEHWTRVRSQEGKPKQGIRAITKYSSSIELRMGLYPSLNPNGTKVGNKLLLSASTSNLHSVAINEFPKQLAFRHLLNFRLLFQFQ